MNEEQKSSYHLDAVRKFRGQPPSSASVIPSTSSGTPPDTPTKRPQGRPPLMGLVAMTPQTLQGRKRHLMRQKRKQICRSKKARAAAQLRFSDVHQDTGCMSSDDLSSDEETTDDISSSILTPDGCRKNVYRAKCRLRGVFTNDSLDNLKLLYLFNKVHLLPSELSCELNKLDPVFSPEIRKYRYRVTRLSEIFNSIRDDVIQPLLKYWIENILLSNVAESILASCDVVISDDLIPTSVIVTRSVMALAQKYVGPSSKNVVERLINGINIIIEVAKMNNLKCGDASVLATATNYSKRFARKVLKALDSGTEEDLKQLRKERFDSIHVTEWPTKIVEFVLRPENSRATPGQDTVSVSYGVRKPKYILLHSRSKIANDFNSANPDCKFSTSIIKREFPPNAITPTSRDKERNTCLIHANIQRVV